MLATSASRRSELTAARQTPDVALRLNSEETGALVLRGEVEFAQGNLLEAEREFIRVVQANPHAANVRYFRGYVAWKQGDARQGSAMLKQMHDSLGPDWKPAGSVMEGDARDRMYSESGFLGVFAQQWIGDVNPSRAYARLDAYLQRLHQKGSAVTKVPVAMVLPL